MAFGQESRAIQLSIGLNLFFEQTNLPPGASVVAKNLCFDEVGAMKKRKGYVRFIQRRFTGEVTAIIPVLNCFRQIAYLVGHQNLDLRLPGN